MTENQPAWDPSSRSERPRANGRVEAGPSVLTPPIGVPIPAQRPSQELPPVTPELPSVAPDPPPAPPRARRDVTTTLVCRCGHGVDEHEHFRPGRDCGTCGAEVCARFRATGGVLARLRDAVARLLRRRA
jgi:hypothetical protein